MAPFARGGLHPAGEASNHKSESHLHFTTEQEAAAHSGLWERCSQVPAS